jgi:pimeloyl-ACP methyl ester carboxylesterase
MYYEIHGTGRPLLLLHGAFMTIDALGPILPALAQTRQVIAVELEGHGHTADLDRPLSVEQMAEDVAGLLEQIRIKQADVFGFSLGGMTALRLAMRHPNLVRKLVIVSASYNREGFYPAIIAMWPDMSAEGFAGSPGEQAYLQSAPNPKHWPVFIEKMKHFMMSFQGWPAAEVQSIKAPTLILLGDTDLIRPEAAIDMFRLLGGCKPDGGMSGGLPTSRLAMLPATTHFTILSRTDLLLPLITPFLDSAGPESKDGEKHDE